MDANKLTQLKELNYTVHPTCGLCRYGVFPNNEWGTCRIHEYSHLKHTDSQRQLSIHKQGSCSSFQADMLQVCKLGVYARFLKTEGEYKE